MRNLFAVFRGEREEKTDERLSAYLDGALSPRERERLEAELARDPQLRARLEALRRTVALVRALPPVRAPRNFILTPAMVAEVRPAPAHPKARPLIPLALTFATALSGLVCILLVVGNLLAAGWGVSGVAAPVPMPAYKAATDQVTTTATVAVPEAPLQETPPLAPARASGAPPEEMPHPLESAPPGLGGGGAGGIGGGWEPGSSETPSGGGEMEAFSTASEATTPTAALRLPEQGGTPTPEPTPGPVSLPTPGEAMETSTTPLLLPWLPVGGMALLTLALAILTVRAWRAR